MEPWIINNKIAALDLETGKNYDIPNKESGDVSLMYKIGRINSGSNLSGLL